MTERTQKTIHDLSAQMRKAAASGQSDTPDHDRADRLNAALIAIFPRLAAATVNAPEINDPQIVQNGADYADVMAPLVATLIANIKRQIRQNTTDESAAQAIILHFALRLDEYARHGERHPGTVYMNVPRAPRQL